MAVKIIICLFCCCCKTLKITAKAERVGIIAPCANWFIINKGCKIPVHTVHPNIHQKKTNSLVAFDKGGLKLHTYEFSEKIKSKHFLYLAYLLISWIAWPLIPIVCFGRHMGSMAQRTAQKTTHPQGFVEVCPMPYRGNMYFSWDRNVTCI